MTYSDSRPLAEWIVLNSNWAGALIRSPLISWFRERYRARTRMFGLRPSFLSMISVTAWLSPSCWFLAAITMMPSSFFSVVNWTLGLLGVLLNEPA